MELYHHGIKGQKWRVRRFQNYDGSLTPEGRERYGVGSARIKTEQDLANARKKVKNDETQNIPNAKRLENYTGPAYFISEKKLDTNNALNPRIPNNYFTKNGYEDNTTPRVSFAPSIDNCLAGLSQNVEGKTYYVYQPKDISKCYVYKPNTKAVPDSSITDELWITNPVEVKQTSKIKVVGNKGNDGIVFKYGNNEAMLYNDWVYNKV